MDSAPANRRSWPSRTGNPMDLTDCVRVMTADVWEHAWLSTITVQLPPHEFMPLSGADDWQKAADRCIPNALQVRVRPATMFTIPLASAPRDRHCSREPFDEIPDDWTCPDLVTLSKSEFEAIEE